MGFFSKLFGKPEGNNSDHIYAPVAGQAVDISVVPDPVFAERMLGNGIAIYPTDGRIYAPVDGTVSTVFETGHAVSVVSNRGAEILIHIGLETVSLEGKPFTVYVKNGDKVKKGQLLLEADLEHISKAGLSTITPVLICNTNDYTTFNSNVDKAVTNDDVVIELDK